MESALEADAALCAHAVRWPGWRVGAPPCAPLRLSLTRLATDHGAVPIDRRRAELARYQRTANNEETRDKISIDASGHARIRRTSAARDERGAGQAQAPAAQAERAHSPLSGPHTPAARRATADTRIPRCRSPRTRNLVPCPRHGTYAIRLRYTQSRTPLEWTREESRGGDFSALSTDHSL